MTTGRGSGWEAPGRNRSDAPERSPSQHPRRGGGPGRICIEIDAVVCDSQGRRYREAEPRPEAIERINELYRDGHRIVLTSSRGMEELDGDVARVYETWFRVTYDQLQAWSVLFHELVLGWPPANVHVCRCGIDAERWLEDPIATRVG